MVYISISVAVVFTDEQGFQNPQGYKGKVMEGKGRGSNIITLAKPLPLSRVVRYYIPRSLGQIVILTGYVTHTGHR